MRRYKEISGVAMYSINENLQVSNLARINNTLSHEALNNQDIDIESTLKGALFDVLNDSFKGKNIAIVYNIDTTYRYNLKSERLESTSIVFIVEVYKI